MLAVPITHVADTLTLNAVIEISCFRFRCPALTGLHAGPPMLAFEPRSFDNAPPPAIYELPVSLTRLVIVGLAPDWNEHLLEAAREVGAWAAGTKPVEDDSSRRHPRLHRPTVAVSVGAPQPRAPLKKIFRQMEESGTAVAGFSLTMKKRRLKGAAAVLVNGAGATNEIRQRLDLGEHATLTYLASDRGWLF